MRRGRFLERIIYGDNGPSYQRPYLLPLHVISIFYGLGIRARLLLYRTGFLKGSRIPCKVISVGNITLGGTGKTPTVEYIAKLLKEENMDVVLLSRGYGGRMERKFGVVSDGNRTLLSLRKAGDEPYMLAQRLEGIPIIVGRRRDLSGQYAFTHFHPHVAILDDGFQHFGVERDVNILLVDSQTGFGNGYLFPSGPLREPLAQLTRADLFIMTKVKDLDTCEELEETIKFHKRGAVIFHSNYSPDYLIDLNSGKRFPVEYIKGRSIAALSGIANPAYFRHLLEQVGAKVEEEIVFPDHHVYSRKDTPIIKRCIHKAKCIVTTEKDAAKLSGGVVKRDFPIMSLSISLKIIEGDHFKRVLLDLLVGPSK
ncbi:MAG: tetraacyldisaccharide 4'-kinase [Syntrophobacterales bacterium]|nr:MAG: tetraacyldisaccharide 4'-kinase [Syntrophobacterales bacterium]